MEAERGSIAPRQYYAAPGSYQSHNPRTALGYAYLVQTAQYHRPRVNLDSLAAVQQRIHAHAAPFSLGGAYLRAASTYPPTTECPPV